MNAAAMLGGGGVWCHSVGGRGEIEIEGGGVVDSEVCVCV